MKKIFILAGELSGDTTAAWYIHMCRLSENAELVGVGGDHMKAAGVFLMRSYDDLNVTGVIEIIRHIPRIFRIMRTIQSYIRQHAIEEVILVDFPGFNVRLAERLKKSVPSIKITYVAPPQLWCWGAWRVKKIKKYMDRVVVLYPFEVEWYAKHGVAAQWIGCPTYDVVAPYIERDVVKEPLIALMPGSRRAEVQRLAPLLSDVALRLHATHPHVKFVMPLASSLPKHFVEDILRAHGIDARTFPIDFIEHDQQKFEVLRRCAVAITKPGTVTLELGLLGVPALVFFTISRLSYLLAKLVVKVRYMALPNLFLDKNMYYEAVQKTCTVVNIVQQVTLLLEAHGKNSAEKKQFEHDVHRLRSLFLSKE